MTESSSIEESPTSSSDLHEEASLSSTSLAKKATYWFALEKCRYDPDMESFWGGDKFLRRAVILSALDMTRRIAL
jgi:hypothetical protein